MIDGIINILIKNKAENVSIYKNIRCEDDSTYIVTSCLSNKHAKSVAQYIIQEIKHELFYTVEGLEEGNWVLLDIEGGVMIHIFADSVRDYYAVDELWAKLGNDTPVSALE